MKVSCIPRDGHYVDSNARSAARGVGIAWPAMPGLPCPPSFHFPIKTTPTALQARGWHGASLMPTLGGRSCESLASAGSHRLRRVRRWSGAGRTAAASRQQARHARRRSATARLACRTRATTGVAADACMHRPWGSRFGPRTKALRAACVSLCTSDGALASQKELHRYRVKSNCVSWA